MYKIYVGQYEEKGTPATWTICGKVPKKHLKTYINRITPNLKHGMELYIVTPKGEVKAYFRDKLKSLFDEK